MNHLGIRSISALYNPNIRDSPQGEENLSDLEEIKH